MRGLLVVQQEPLFLLLVSFSSALFTFLLLNSQCCRSALVAGPMESLSLGSALLLSAGQRDTFRPKWPALCSSRRCRSEDPALCRSIAATDLGPTGQEAQNPAVRTRHSE